MYTQVKLKISKFSLVFLMHIHCYLINKTVNLSFLNSISKSSSLNVIINVIVSTTKIISKWFMRQFFFLLFFSIFHNNFQLAIIIIKQYCCCCTRIVDLKLFTLHISTYKWCDDYVSRIKIFNDYFYTCLALSHIFCIFRSLSLARY